jgi:hypothetical protein
MAFNDTIFWGCLGGIFCWIIVGSILSSWIKKRQPYRNRFFNKLADNIEIIAILPLVPPILLYALILRFGYDPIKRVVKKGNQRIVDRRQELANKQFAGELRRCWARDDLAHVRREKLPLINESEHCDNWPLHNEQELRNNNQENESKATEQTVSPQVFHFAKLPAELRIQIYGLLDYGTALKLLRANRFFYFERPHESIDKEQRMTFLFYAEAFSHNRRRLACYECLRARSHGDFLEEYRNGEFGRFGDRELERWCFDCVAKTADANVSRMKLWRFRFWRWRVRAFHGAKDRRDSV